MVTLTSVNRSSITRITIRQLVELFFLALLLFLIPINLIFEQNTLSAMDKGLLFCTCVILYLTNFYVVLRDGKMDVMSPIFFFSIIFFLGYLVPINGFLNGTDIMSQAWPYSYYDYEIAMTKTFSIILITILAFSLGTFIPLKRFSIKPSFYISKNRLNRVLQIFFGIGIGCFFLAVYLVGGIGVFFAGLGDRIRLFAGLNYLFFALLFLPISALIWWSKILFSKEKISLFFIFFAVFTLFLSAFLGGKANTFIIILAFIVVYHKYVKSITLSLFLVLSFFGLLGMRLFELFFREFLVLGKIVSVDFSQLDTLLNDLLIRGFEGNFLQFQILTIAVDYVPKALDFQLGNTYSYLFLAPIPSSIWAEKPLAPSAVLTLPIWPDKWFLSGTSMPPSLIGEFYINFNMIGVFFGSLIFGFIYNYCYIRYYRTTTDPMKISFYGIFIAFMLYFIRGNFADPFILLMIMILPLTIGFKFIKLNVLKI
jgi:oligosaccharide repeat unit polymerase